MFTVPSGFLGTFGVFTDGHWASSDGDSAAKSANTRDANTLISNSSRSDPSRGS
jgi:hypothetical protein